METLMLPGCEIELVRIEAGEFVMGSPNVQFDEAPQHRVQIRNPFYLSKTPVTQQQWENLLGTNPSHFHSKPDHPVENITWDHAVRFCRAASEHTGVSVRLPSEAEWEHACRAGTSSEFFFSSSGDFPDDAAIPAATRRELQQFAWFEANSRQSTAPVGTKRPNPWGLHDMIGNVWEWCKDFWHEGFQEAPKTEEPWIHPRPARPVRCQRGGAWNMDAFRCRSCYRSWDWETVGTSRTGLRICVDAA